MVKMKILKGNLKNLLRLSQLFFQVHLKVPSSGKPSFLQRKSVSQEHLLFEMVLQLTRLLPLSH